LNNNRNNRRRGRGNRHQNGGNSANRIDSRARGNAPQLLDKYKKLAQDAQHNGDRVQAEYYLQFADHYFRVIADNKARQEEARAKRQEDREQSGNDGSEDDAKENDDNRRNNRRSRSRRDDREQQAQDEGERGVEGEPAADNGGEDAKPRRSRRKPAGNGSADRAADEIDAGVLPPAIASSDEDSEESKPKPRRRRKPDAEGGDEEVQAVG